MRKYFITFGLIILAVNLASAAEILPIDQCLKLMQSTNRFERSQAINTLDRQRQEIVRQLIDILHSSAPIQVKLDAGRELVEYPSPAAIKILIKNLPLELVKLPAPSDGTSDQVLFGMITEQEMAAISRPFSTALEEIGTPAIPELIKCITSNDDVQIQNLSLKILYRIEGDKDVSILRLQKAVKAEADAQKQARLQAALKMLTDLSAKN